VANTLKPKKISSIFDFATISSSIPVIDPVAIFLAEVPRDQAKPAVGCSPFVMRSVTK
jgi:hypothetical protein